VKLNVQNVVGSQLQKKCGNVTAFMFGTHSIQEEYALNATKDGKTLAALNVTNGRHISIGIQI
jgi:hypothetical protein